MMQNLTPKKKNFKITSKQSSLHKNRMKRKLIGKTAGIETMAAYAQIQGASITQN